MFWTILFSYIKDLGSTRASWPSRLPVGHVLDHFVFPYQGSRIHQGGMPQQAVCQASPLFSPPEGGCTSLSSWWPMVRVSRDGARGAWVSYNFPSLKYRTRDWLCLRFSGLSIDKFIYMMPSVGLFCCLSLVGTDILQTIREWTVLTTEQWNCGNINGPLSSLKLKT